MASHRTIANSRALKNHNTTTARDRFRWPLSRALARTSFRFRATFGKSATLPLWAPLASLLHAPSTVNILYDSEQLSPPWSAQHASPENAAATTPSSNGPRTAGATHSAWIGEHRPWVRAFSAQVTRPTIRPSAGEICPARSRQARGCNSRRLLGRLRLFPTSKSCTS